MLRPVRHYDVIVVGGGAVGASALFHLTRSGRKNVLLLERKAAFGRGATGSWGSLVRVFHLNDLTSERAMETVPYYLDFEARTGYPSGFEQTGSLYFLKTGDLPSIQAKVDRLNQGRLRLELVFAREGRQQFPAFQWMDDDVAVYESHGGCCCPYTVTESWIRAARDAGAEARADEGVTEFIVHNGRVQGVRTSQGEYHADQVVVSAGVWSKALLDSLGETVPMVPTVIQVNEFFRVGSELRSPFFIDLANNTFGRQSHSGSLMAGYLHDRPNEQASFVQQLSLREAHDAKRHVAARLNWIKNASLRGGIRATEGYTADGNGILRYTDRYDNVLVAAAWSCQGFTLAPWVGAEIAAHTAARQGSPA